MEIINMLIDFFGLYPDFITFPEFLVWFCKLLLAVAIVGITIKSMWQATWKIERSLR